MSNSIQLRAVLVVGPVLVCIRYSDPNQNIHVIWLLIKQSYGGEISVGA